MKVKMMVISMIVAFVASSQAMEICSGESAEQVIDLRNEPLLDSIDISYNSSWVGGNSSAEVVITDNGTEIKRTVGEGEFAWAATPGKHMLTYTTYIDGVQQDEVYTATVFKDRKYTVEDGKATIVETTQTSGDIIIPSEIDGYPVVAIGEDVFTGCEGLTSVVIPESITSVGVGAFSGCTGIRSIVLSSALKVGCFKTGLYQVKFNNSDDFTSSIMDSESKALVSGVLMGDAYDTESVTRLYTDPKYGGSHQWNSRYTTFGYAGYMYMVEGRTYVFGKYFDDSVLVRINGNEVLKNTDHTAFATGKYVPGKTGWHEIEVRVADGTGEKGPKGVASSGYWSGNLGVGWRDDGITDALPESGWNKMMDPGDGSLFRCFEGVKDLSMRDLFPDSYDKLTSVTLTGDETKIPDSFLAGCVALESFIIPDGVTTIGANAFEGCSSLTEIVIPDSVTHIESGFVYDLTQNAWMVLNDESDDDKIVYKSNDINHYGSTYMTMTVKGPLELSFDWKVSSESGWDYLKWYLDGTEKSAISGTGSGWQTVTSSIPAGEHTIKWQYSKDQIDDNGEDCGWVGLPRILFRMQPTFEGCTNLTSITISSDLVTKMSDMFPDSYDKLTSVTLIGDASKLRSDAFEGCSSIAEVTMNANFGSAVVPGFYEAEFKSMTSFDDAISIVDNRRGVVLSADMLTADTTTDHTMYGYAAKMFFEGGVEYGFLAYYDDKSSVKIDGVNVISASSVECRSQTCTVKYEESGWHDIELRGWNNGGEGAAYGSCEGIMWKKGSGAWQKFADPGDGSLFRASGSMAKTLKDLFPNSYEKLTCVTLTGDLVEIPDNFFKDCASLEEIKFSGENARVGKNAFDGCSSLDITTQNGFRLYKGWCLEYVGGDAATLNIPNGVIGIADGAFEGKTSLKAVTFPDSLRFIGADAFAGCTQLAELTLPDNIVEIADGAFRDCTWVQNVKMPSNLERIGAAAFANCAYLPNIVCADGLEEIGVGAFSNCWRMTSVSLPASLDSVGRDAFWNCKNLGGVTVPAHVQPLKEMFSAAYSALSSIIIAEGETELCEGAFEGCAGVTKIDIPEAITNIPARAFKNCTNFDRLVLPSGLLAIGDEAFYGCSKIESLTLPKNLTSIGAGAFNGWALLDVITIPDGVTFIGSGAFAGCTDVRQVRMPSNVATVSATFPDAYTKIVRVTIPNNSTAIIAGFLNGCTSITAFDIPLSVTEIGDNAFRGCKNLIGITLPDGLDKIGSYAFYGCTLINDLSIPFSVTSIGNNAFGSCAQIRSVVISGEAGTLSSLFPNAYQQIVSVTVLSGSEKLMDRIFAGCKSLKNVDIPTSVTEIGEGAFENCTALTSVGIPSGVTVLGKGAFRGCTTLSEITLPTGLSILEDEVFSLCSCLSTITVPESVVEIGSKVFNGCSSLHSVKFVGNAPLADVESYTGVSSSLITYVPYASVGWDGISTSIALPEFWPVGYENTIEWWDPIRFDVTFDWNYEAGEAGVIEQVVDTTYILPDVDPTREGAAFAGWWTATAEGARITPASRVMLTTPHTLYAHWRMNTYSVVFDANGGIGAMESMDLTVNKPAVLTACGFTRFDSDFVGWAIEPEGEVLYRDCAEISNLTFENDAVVTLYAVWTPRTWTEGDYLNQPGFTFTSEGDEPWVTDAEVSHDGIGSLRSGAIGASAEYPNRTYSAIKTTVVGEGTGSFWWKVHCEEMDSEYGDWFDYAVFTVDGVEIAKIAGDTDWTKVTYSVIGAGEHELIWTFTRDDYDLEGAEWLNAAWLDELVWSPKMVALKFDAGGATGDVPEAILRQEGDSVLLPGSGALVKGTDIFKGWSDGTTLYIPGSEYTFGSEDETLTAIWEEKVWTLAEAADADALVMTTGGIADWTIDATTGYTNTMSIKSGVVSSGQESWIETKVNGSGELTFRWNVKGGAYRDQPFAYAKVEVDGAEFASEYLTDDWEEVVLMIDDDSEHTIRWTYLRTSTRAADGDCAWIDAVSWKSFRIVNSSIVYENLRGATHTNPEAYQEGNVVEFTNPSEVEGHTFVGWTPERISADMTGMQTVRANWMANKYTIAYNDNGGNGTMEATLATYDSEVIVKDNAFVREGYTFKGWALEEGGDVAYAPGQTVINLTAQADIVITFYAVWERILIAVDEPVVGENLVYNGLEQMGVIEADGYTLSGVSAAIDAGEYSATATLADGYKWADGSMDDKVVTWSIAKAANEWITEPKISLESWIEGETAGELTDGVAKFGEVTATISGIDFTALPIAPGSYTIEYSVAETGNYSGLTKYVTFEIIKYVPIIISEITYENLHGATHANPETYQEGTVVEFTNPSEVDGYTFVGWTPERISADITGAQTVRANWTANNYTIAYNSNGGSGTMEPTLATYDSEAIVKNNEFVRDGYTFKGWALEESGDVVYVPGQSVMNLTAQADGVITFYAVWERILIAVDEPVAVDNLIYNASEQIGIAEAEGYTLSGESAAIDAGEYTATATLADGYKWADGSMEDKTITWSIAKATNEWITEPKISLESWTEGDVAGELTDGVAKFGEVIATINGAAFTELPTAIGSYSIAYKVAETGNYSELTKLVAFEIVEKPNPIPAINPDWGYVVTELGENKNEVAIVFTNHTEKAMTWTVPVNLENVQFLVVGGGGGGSTANNTGAGGGGGGGVVTGIVYQLQAESKVSVGVGAGGAGGYRKNNSMYAGGHGGASTISLDGTLAVTAYGGARSHRDSGYSGEYGSGNGSTSADAYGVAKKGVVADSAIDLVYGVESFGNNGGYGYSSKIGGGGGGAYPGEAGKGGTATSSTAGRGGAGLVSDITGSKVTYGSGGGGSAAKAGAEGGEGAGNGSSNKNAVANQGGGGGGADDYSNGGAGGSGIVVIRYTIPSYLLPEDAEALPEVTDDSKVAAALEGSADAKLAENITDAATYMAFREWALNLEGVTPEEVKSSLNAWLSYALNTAALIIDAPKEGDVIINAFESAVTEGAFEFTVKIDGITVGENALGANLRKVFEVEGAETLANGGAGFSTDNVEVNTATPESGNVKFSVTPKKGNGEKPNSFFFRAKMK